MSLESLPHEYDDTGARGDQRRREMNPPPGRRVAFNKRVDECERAPARLREQHRHETRHDVVYPEQIRRLAERVGKPVRLDLPEAQSRPVENPGNVGAS